MGQHSEGPICFNTPSMVTATLGANDGEVGDLRTWNGKTYRLVYNTGNSTIPPGHGATVSAVSGYSVTVSSTVSNMVAIGICEHASITTGTYGYLLVKGFCSYEADANAAVTAGEALALAADGVWVNASGITGPAYGKAMVATASGGSATGYFNF